MLSDILPVHGQPFPSCPRLQIMPRTAQLSMSVTPQARYPSLIMQCNRADEAVQGRACVLTMEAKVPMSSQAKLDNGRRDRPLWERRLRVRHRRADVERQKNRLNRRRRQSSPLELTAQNINLASRHIVAPRKARRRLIVQSH